MKELREKLEMVISVCADRVLSKELDPSLMDLKICMDMAMTAAAVIDLLDKSKPLKRVTFEIPNDLN